MSPRDMTTTGPTLGSPRWAGDYLGGHALVPGPFKVDESQFTALDAVRVETTAISAVDDTSLDVVALSGPIPAGTILDFGGKKLARTSAAAAAGAVAIAVDALGTALADGDIATYAGTEGKYIPSGTPVGRTTAERDAGDGFGPADADDDEIFLSAFDIDDADENNDLELYRHNHQVFENYLPVVPADMATGLEAVLRGLYHMTLGHE